jgi:quercetin dioxygenase-like cupin family protein
MERCSGLKSEKTRFSKSELSQPVRLVDLINYQEGAVVSRTILDKKSGTITLFAFDKNEGLSEHTAPYEVLIQLLDGEAEVIIASKPSVLKTGELVVLPANSPHALRATERFKMLLVMIRS